MIYDYQIAGIRVRCQLPHEIAVDEESRAFLTPFFCEPDLVFSFEAVDSIFDPGQDGLLFQTARYVADTSGYCVFHYSCPNNPPYAVVRWNFQNPKSLRCEFLRGEEDMISRSRNLVNLLGLETLLLQHNALLLHCSFIRVNNCGILFTAPSGTGKSTQASLWEESRGAQVINGDRAALRFNNSSWTAWGLPYAGTSGIYRNESAPLSAIVVLRQAKENRIRKLSPGEAFRYMYPELTLHRWESQSVDCSMDLLLKLVQNVPVYFLECLPDLDAVELTADTFLKGGIFL